VKSQKREAAPSRDVLLRYIQEIDRFANQLRETQDRIKALEADCTEKREAFEASKTAVRDEKEVEHATVTMLLKFVAPGSLETFPLFDKMEPPDEETHGANAADWRKEPITALRLSAVAVQLLVAADIVLVGQLQDAMLADASDWWERIEGLSSGLADAIQVKFDDFVSQQVKK
jgi:hypothetical protein